MVTIFYLLLQENLKYNFIYTHMKHLKKFEEKIEEEDIILYRNDEFTISMNNNNSNMTFFTSFYSKSPIYGMMDLIRNKSKYLNDNKLREIEITEKEIEFALLSLNPKFFDNRINNRSSVINGFIDNYTHDEIKEIQEKAYIELNNKYLPIIKDVIIDSKKLGDIIDKFKVVYKQINDDLPFYVTTAKYNV